MNNFEIFLCWLQPFILNILLILANMPFTEWPPCIIISSPNNSLNTLSRLLRTRYIYNTEFWMIIWCMLQILHNSLNRLWETQKSRINIFCNSVTTHTKLLYISSDFCIKWALQNILKTFIFQIILNFTTENKAYEFIFLFLTY